MGVVHKATMPRKIVEILSDDSDSSSEDSEYCVESDDNDVENVVCIFIKFFISTISL